MIPSNFYKFLKDLKRRTLDEGLVWSSHSDTRMVEYDHENFNIRIRYYFDDDLGTPFFYIYYVDKTRGEDYVFNTSKYEADYYEIEDIFAIAQDSGFNSPW